MRLLELVPDAAFFCAPDGSLLFANAAFLRLAGAETTSAATRGAHWITPVAGSQSVWQQARHASGLTTLAVYVKGDHDTGRYRARVRAVRNATGDTVTGYEGVLLAMTDSSETQRKMRRLKARLVRRSAHVRAARAEERKALSRLLHDDLGQTFVVLKMELERMADAAPMERDSANVAVDRRAVNALRTWSEDAIRKVRTLCSELREVKGGLLDVPALLEPLAREFSRRWNIPTRMDVAGDRIRIDARRAVLLAEMCREALTNVARHARATTAAIRIVRRGSHFTVSVCDNGRGLPAHALERADSFGVMGMRERARAIGGAVNFSRRRAETVVAISVPFQPRPVVRPFLPGPRRDQDTHR